MMKCKQTVKMAAPAIVRVKRARTEQPLEALVVSSKRRKPNEDGDETPITTVLTFAGTVNSLEENVHTHISKTFSSLKEKSQDTFKTYKPKVTEKLRDQLKTKWHEDRFKVVSFHRFQGTPEEESGSKGGQENITVVDVEPTGNEEDFSGSPKLATLGKYEYDLYYAESAADLCSGVLETVLSVQPLELVNEAELSPDEEIGEDSDNEDDENNWRNDYPDEEGSSDEDGLAAPRSSRYMREDDDDELMRHMERFGIGSGEELSSDEADEALIYGRPQSPFERYRSRCIREVDPDCDSYSDKSAEETFDDDD